MSKVTYSSLILLFMSFSLYNVNCYLIDATDEAFRGKSDGILAAFGDFNSDKKTDLFVITANGKSLSIFNAEEEGHFVKQVLIPGNSSLTEVINGVVPADFDGDSQMDVLLVKHKDGDIDQPYKIEIHWGATDGKSLDAEFLTLPDKLLDHPLVLDYNGDLIPDLLAESTPGNRSFWTFSSTRNFTRVPFQNGSSSELPPSLHKPQSSAFVDLNKDLTPDLLVVSDDPSGSVQFEWWIVQEGVLKWNRTVPIMAPPAGETWKYVGQVSVADIDHDEEHNLILPVCTDEQCANSFIYALAKNQWINLNVSFTNGKVKWGFLPPSKSSLPDIVNLPVTLRMADYTMDGFPDFIATLYDTENSSVPAQSLIFSNVPCTDCQGFDRTFSIQWEATKFAPTEANMMATFFDYEENGNLDVVMTTFVTESKQPHLRLLKSKSTDNMCFLKVMVLTGLCNGKCVHGVESYGVNLPGPTTWYHTLTSEGNPQISTATQLSQSAHFSLQTPYTIIGLGQTPNFIEEFEVGIQRPLAIKEPLHKTWSYIIPNSQLIVIPTPQLVTSSWKYKLFLTPSELVLLTGASLLGTCGVITIIVGLLHWRERVADKREKIQESQRFHFDAM